ncbi:MAG: hypothetical protein OSA48_10210 [Akkermansiaceae bacterium]|nr:hypothetical protein [Akkermansiaceae bacterium]
MWTQPGVSQWIFRGQLAEKSKALRLTKHFGADMVGAMRRTMKALALVALWSGSAIAGVDFETEVMPILEAKCFKCHGNGKSKGDLSLESGSISREIGSSKLIRPGDPKKSPLIIALTSDEEDMMPPKGGPIGKAQIAILTQWVKEGASMRKGGAVVVEGDRKPLQGTWTNTGGKAIVADLLKVEKGKAVLRLKNGKIYEYPLEKLDEKSRKRAEDWAAGKLEEE